MPDLNTIPARRGGQGAPRADVSACPQDILPINGVGHAPTEAHFSVG